MNKEQSADDPCGSDSCKNMLVSTICELPDVVIVCIEHMCLWKHSEHEVAEAR